MEIWHGFRNEAIAVGRELHKIRRRHKGRLPMQDETVISLIEEITVILDKCSQWMDKRGASVSRTLWDYNARDERTHISSEKFAYKHLMHLI